MSFGRDVGEGGKIPRRLDQGASNASLPFSTCNTLSDDVFTTSHQMRVLACILGDFPVETKLERWFRKGVGRFWWCVARTELGEGGKSMRENRRHEAT